MIMRLRSGVLAAAVAVLLAVVPFLLFSTGVQEDKAYPVAESATAGLPELDARLFSDAGISASGYSVRSYSAGGTAWREYQLRDGVADLAALDERVAAAIDRLRQSMPRARDLVAEFGNPTGIVIGDAGSAVYVNVSYGSVTFFTNAAVSATTMEIRVDSSASPYRLRTSIRVGSTLDDVFAVLGKPVKTVEGAQLDFSGDRVLSIARGSGQERSHIRYGTEGVRFFGTGGVVNAMYLFPPDSGQSAAREAPTPPRSTTTPASPTAPITAVAPYADVRGKDLSSLGEALDAALLRTLWLNLDTKLDAAATKLVQQVIEAGRNPGLGVRGLHAQGITGAGVSVAIIDQNLPGTNHPEYAGKVAKYRDVGTDQPPNSGSMHGPAVLSLLVGQQAGTAPGARVWYAAAPSWLGDAKYYADALRWIIEENRTLPGAGKIRVVSVSAAPSGPGSPFTKNGGEWDAAVAAAEAAGILVLDCTQTHGFIGSCFYDPADPENVSKCTPGFPGQAGSNPSTDHLLAPTSYRSTAESYRAGQESWQYTGRGGLSWGIPWAAGILAMGWQVNPSLGSQQMVQLLRDTAFLGVNGSRIVDPAAFIAAVRKTVR